jgi:hypothetical protein
VRPCTAASAYSAEHTEPIDCTQTVFNDLHLALLFQAGRLW